MATFTQANQPIEVATPLGKDVMLLTGFHGDEGISRLFHFQLDLIAETKKEIAFDKILGQKITIRLNMPNGKPRFFNGICNRISQGGGDADFTNYQLEIVPHVWLLTKNAQSRIFQQISVPDILKAVFKGFDVAYQIEGTFHPRNYCVQYRETDFNFAARLMEEEGIYFFFTFGNDSHKMIVANTPPSHPALPLASAIEFERMRAGAFAEDRIVAWSKQQELVTGKHTLRDHKFEMHGKNLEAAKSVLDSVQVGKATHKIKAGSADSREIYDYPGEYAQRFDGITPGGGERSADINKILQDNERVAGIRAQQEAVQAVIIHAASFCRNLVSGHKFTLQKHGPGDGDYVITSVQHQTINPVDFHNPGAPPFQYSNSFTCIPAAMPFRPQRLTPKPFVQGTQTAVVVGPAGEEIFCDKYGRVKAQFHWDRDGKLDANSSCWMRVATHWAGREWGIVHIPRIGHEVIVGFEEGDPDQPIIIGSVYNNDHMPPYKLPDHKTQSGVKSRSSLQGTPANFNEIRFEDLKGKEQVIVHAERDMATSVEANQNNTIGHNHVMTIGTDPNGDPKKDGTSTTTIFGDTKLTVTKGDYTVTIESGSAYLFVNTHNREVVVKEYYRLWAKGIYAESEEEDIVFKSARAFDVTATTFIEHQIGDSANWSKIMSDGKHHLSAATEVGSFVGSNTIQIANNGIIQVRADSQVFVKAGSDITLKVGDNSIVIDTGGITINGKKIASTATDVHEIKGSQVKINC